VLEAFAPCGAARIEKQISTFARILDDLVTDQILLFLSKSKALDPQEIQIFLLGVPNFKHRSPKISRAVSYLVDHKN
jgi:hypothetical protein